ncbi:hypothetical protein GCM10029992_45170 [Glycomyces albus]
MRVVVVACDEAGNIDVADLEAKIAAHGDALAALMVTYPSTHGVFESSIVEVCGRVHDAGGQVYVDGANLNALLGWAKPGRFGADVSHLNLHKTFCIPHGGGGPGVGPVAVAEHLVPFLPSDPMSAAPGRVGPVAQARWGSAGILQIPWMYLRMMGPDGVAAATASAVLAANYVAARLGEAFPILYAGEHGLVAHECILDLRELSKRSGVSVEDVAKRLIDYGFHAPTMSFPVAGTLMVEPTESEDLAELDRFCEAMIAIRAEIEAVSSGVVAVEDSPLRSAPHTAAAVTAEAWDRAYSRAEAAWPAGVGADKYWPPVGRVDNAWGIGTWRVRVRRRRRSGLSLGGGAASGGGGGSTLAAECSPRREADGFRAYACSQVAPDGAAPEEGRFAVACGAVDCDHAGVRVGGVGVDGRVRDAVACRLQWGHVSGVGGGCGECRGDVGGSGSGVGAGGDP